MQNTDLRQMLMGAGVGSYTSVMSIPYMNMLPNTTDPYAQGVIQIVQGLQRLLVARGAPIPVDGGMGHATVRAVKKFAGPLWYDKSWAQLYGDVMNAVPWEGWRRESRAKTQVGLEGLGAINAVVVVPIFTPGTVAVAKLQIAINRMNQAIDIGDLLRIDGRVGTATKTALNRIANATISDGNPIGSAILGQAGSNTAYNAASLTTLLNNMAATAGVPALLLQAQGPFAPGDKSAPPAPPANTPGLPNSGFMATLKSPIGIAALAVGGLLLVAGSKKKGRRR